MFSGCEDACAPDRLDLLLRLAGEEAGLDDHRLLRQVALAKDLTGGRKKGISGLGQRVDYCLELFHKVHGRHGISQKKVFFQKQVTQLKFDFFSSSLANGETKNFFPISSYTFSFLKKTGQCQN